MPYLQQATEPSLSANLSTTSSLQLNLEILNIREIAPTSSLVAPGEEERRERAGLQALRERIVRQERHGARPPALPLRGVRPQLHGHAAPRQAAGDEGLGGAALRPRQRQPGDDRQAARGQPRRRLQVG